MEIDYENSNYEICHDDVEGDNGTKIGDIYRVCYKAENEIMCFCFDIVKAETIRQALDEFLRSCVI